jgi:hypothetical protein
MPRLFACLILLLIACPIAPVRAAEGYANCAHYVDSLPTSIGTQGVWCLRHDLSTNIASGNAITITTNNVSIDCNDFKLGGLAAGAGSQAYGIYANDRQNVAVRHCNVRGFLGGIRLVGDNASGYLVEDNRLDNNLRVGINAQGKDAAVRRNRVYDTGGATGLDASWGISAAGHVDDNIVDGLFADAANGTTIGIDLSAVGSEACGNIVRGLMPSGTGLAYGVRVLGGHDSVTRNRIVAPAPVSGTAIAGAGAGSTFCGGNFVANFDTGWSGCQVPAGRENASNP